VEQNVVSGRKDGRKDCTSTSSKQTQILPLKSAGRRLDQTLPAVRKRIGRGRQRSLMVSTLFFYVEEGAERSDVDVTPPRKVSEEEEAAGLPPRNDTSAACVLA
jgi:hypothetical protein